MRSRGLLGRALPPLALVALQACSSSESENAGTSGSGGGGGTAGSVTAGTGGESTAGGGGTEQGSGGAAGAGGTTVTDEFTCFLRTVPTSTLIADWECLATDPITGEPDYSSLTVSDFRHGSSLQYDETPEADDAWSAADVVFSGGLRPGRDSDNALGLEMLKPAGNSGATIAIWMGGAVDPDNLWKQECIDFTAYPAISFWLKAHIKNADGTPSSHSHIRVEIATISTMPVYDEQGVYVGGCCDLGDACRHAGVIVNVNASAEWTHFVFSLTSFVDGSAALSPREVQGMLFKVAGDPDAEQDLLLHVDDVELVPGPSVLPRSCE
jgi:hypothetical protein